MKEKNKPLEKVRIFNRAARKNGEHNTLLVTDVFIDPLLSEDEQDLFISEHLINNVIDWERVK